MAVAVNLRLLSVTKVGYTVNPQLIKCSLLAIFLAILCCGKVQSGQMAL